MTENIKLIPDSAPKKRLPRRDSATGKFDDLSPANDPAIKAFAIRTVHAIRDLRPIAQAMAEDHGDDKSKLLAQVMVLWFDGLEASMLDSLAIDPEALKEAKKPVLRPRYGRSSL